MGLGFTTISLCRIEGTLKTIKSMEKELRKVMMESTFSMATSSMTRKSQETFVMGRSSMKVDFLITCTMGKES